MESAMKEFKHLKIKLDEIKQATNNFGSKVLGTGGFGKVFEGEVSLPTGRSIVAIKRLNRRFGQGDPEFLKELMMLSRYKHKNLISLLGFCDEDGEKILVYEYASNGSLDGHLSSTVLSWTQRLKICLDAAQGLAYLHDHKGTLQRVLHRDIKSANILLDDNWNAKLSDMGLSKIGPANQQHTVLFTNIVGTPGYCDPQYMETYTLTKESDIYSFGVVLFEVLCGRACNQYANGRSEILVRMWKQSYIDKKLDDIIFKDLTPPLDPTSLELFSSIAFQCLHNSREERPTTSLLVEKLKIALKFQEPRDMKLTKAVGTSTKSANNLKAIFSKRKTEKGRPIENEYAKGIYAEILHFDGAISFTVDDVFSGPAEVMLESPVGTYYKVLILEKGHLVAVNILTGTFYTKKRDIEAKFNLLGKTRHPNLLPMRAYSLHRRGLKFLVYDYMPKGSLHAFLHDRAPEERIDWATRMRIAKGVARGLHSIHTHHNIFHGILTSSNIWLDEDNNFKFSDFGLSKIKTTGGNSSMKDDVFSLGVLC